jgi:FSR family fosmidomycin resistance protein-like MFS transporter
MVKLSPRGKTFAGLVLGHALLDCYGSFWPIFKYLAGIDVGVAGVLATATSTVAMLLQPVFGHLGHAGRARLFVVGGTALTLLMTLLGPLALGRDALGPGVFVGLMIVILSLTRIGQATFHPVAGVQAGALVRGRRSTLLAVFVAAGWLGVGLSQPVYSWAHFATGGHSEVLLLPGLLLLALTAVWYRPMGIASAGALARNPALGATGALAWLAIGNVLALVLAIGLHQHRD